MKNKLFLTSTAFMALLLSGCALISSVQNNDNSNKSEEESHTQSFSSGEEANHEVNEETFTALITHLGIMDPNANVTIDIFEKDFSSDDFIDEEWYEHPDQFKHAVSNPSSVLKNWEEVTHQIRIDGARRDFDAVGSRGMGYEFKSESYSAYDTEYMWDVYYRGEYDILIKEENKNLYPGELFYGYTLFELFNYEDFTFDEETQSYHLDSLGSIYDDREPLNPWFKGLVSDITLKFENNKLVEYSYFSEYQTSFEYEGKRIWPSGTLLLMNARVNNYGTTSVTLPEGGVSSSTSEGK